MTCRNGFLIFLFSLSNAVAFSQNALIPRLDTLASDFINGIRRKDTEKVFVQTDKWFYAAGEDIWLRVYCIGSLSHKVMRQSKSLLVDLVNERDSLVGRILLNNGLLKLDGRISLPAALPEGYYWLRAYTRRMLKEGTLAVYVQPVYVFNPGREGTPARDVQDFRDDSMTSVKVNPGETGLPIVRFYPEGGSFISGSSTKFAFTAFDQQGRAIDLFGYVTDSANTIVAKYGTSMPGLGSFSLFAEGSMKYIAHTVYGPGKVLAATLPPTQADAYQLTVTGQSDDSVYVQVSLGDSVYKKYKPSYVLGVSRDSLCYAAVGKDMYTFSIAKKNFPGGMASLLLFDAEHKIVSQRDIYIGKANPGFSVVSDQVSYGPRQKVNLTIAAGSAGDGNSPSVFSVAVADEREAENSGWTTSLSRINRDDIVFTYKDLADSVIDHYSPDQWDLVMLVQPNLYLGWQESGYVDSISRPWEQSDSEVTNLTGRVLDRKNLPVKNRIITLLSNSGESILETDTTDHNGRFHFKLPDNILDSTRLDFQVSNSMGGQMEDSIAMDPPGFPWFSTPVVLKKRFSELQNKQKEDFKRYQLDTLSALGKGKEWLKPAIVTRAMKTPVTYDESKIVSPFSRIIPGDQIGLNPNSIENAVLSTAGVSFQNGAVKIRGGGIPDPHSGSTEPLLYVDGFQVPLPSPIGISSPLLSYLETLNPRTIDFIEVLEGADATVYGPGSDRGIVYVHTLNGYRSNPVDGRKKPKVFYAWGYFPAPVFREPDYDKKEILGSPYPDQRSTIYWNGNIITDDRGKANLQFFTADGSKNYSVFAIGLTPGGEILLAKGRIMGR
jgi:hypothetical protein